MKVVMEKMLGIEKIVARTVFAKRTTMLLKGNVFLSVKTGGIITKWDV